jgi:Flp pilus assembly protein TadD
MTIRIADKPYPGPQSFLERDHARFFGRAADAASLAELWRTNRLTIASGPAASGKTSLLRAGVFPQVTGRRADVLPVGRVSYGLTFPLASLPEHNPYTLAVLRSWSSPAGEATRLVGRTVLDFVRRRAERHDGLILAAVDQAEELLTETGQRNGYCRRFLAELAEAIREESRLHLLVVVRDEALGAITEMLGSGASQRVEPLSPENAREAVTGPIVVTGRTFTEDAAERLVTDLRTSRFGAGNGVGRGTQRLIVDDHVEPALLQVACSRLWNELPPDLDVISADDVRRYASVDTALAEFCAHVVAEVADDHEMSSGELRSGLLHAFVTDEGRRGIAYEGAADTAGMPTTAARQLEDMHLLSAYRRSGSRWYELLSDRLIEPLRHAADLRPPPADATKYLRAAERALALGQPELTRRYATASLRAAAVSDFQLRAEANSLLGNLAFDGNRPAEASQRYLDAARLFEAVEDTNAVAYQLAASGRALIASDQLADGVRQLTAAVDRLPNDLTIRTDLALGLWQLGEGNAAVAELTSALGLDGGNPEALRARGEILAYVGNARDAMRDLDRVNSRGRPLTRAAHGLALARLGDQPAAEQEVRDAVEEAESNGPVLLYAARAMSVGGDDAAAEGFAWRAVDAWDPPLSSEQREVAIQLAGRKHKKPTQF